MRVVATDADRVRSAVLGCWLRAVGEGDTVRVRLATGLRGDDLVPSDAERAAAVDRSAQEERRRREHAEAEIARLRERLRAAPRSRRR